HTGPGGTEVADIAAAKADLADKLTISPQMESKLITIEFSFSKPEDCATVINELVDQHLCDQTQVRKSALRARTQDLNQTKGALQLKINHAKEEIAQLTQELSDAGVVTGNIGPSPRGMNMQSLADQQKLALTELNRSKSALETLNKRLLEGQDPVEIDDEVQRDQR